MKESKTLIVQLNGALKTAVEETHGNLEGDPDVLEQLTPQEVARRLIAWGVKEHRAGRGPWRH
jgi:hypothetical protein